ncbi:MAG: hypothetical protein M3487_08545 [Actinomycetota bacterium]|nr:hypothetical protein [Actinomycetota bacterium]
MSFGKPTGPPASSQQVRELLALLQDAGHSDFRDARGPMGFTQRQAGGKFTRDEAAALIEQLQAAADGDDEVAETRAGPPAEQSERLSTAEQALRRIPAERLAGELQRRGWVVIEP